MTLVLDAKRDGPQTHALVVGVGSYPHLSGGTGEPAMQNFGLGQLEAPPKSAEVFTHWLVNHFANPSTPLGTVELLVASRSPFVYRKQDGAGEFLVDPSTMLNFKVAAINWFTRVQEHLENIALFYFCGHGLSLGNDNLLLMQDFGTPEGSAFGRALDFAKFLATMQSCLAKKQIYFIDANRVSPPNLSAQAWSDAETVLSQTQTTVSEQPPLCRAVLYAAQSGSAFSRPGEPSFFSQTLVATLNYHRDRNTPLNTGVLITILRRRLKEASARTGIEQDLEAHELNSFDFHYPPRAVSAAQASKVDAGELASSPESVVGDGDEEAAPPRTDGSPPSVSQKLDAKTAPTGKVEFDTQFVSDDAEIEHDELGRGVLAFALARRLHRIWCSLNGAMPVESPSPPRQPVTAALIDSSTWTGLTERDESCFLDRKRANTRAAFVMHLDAPWGGGKTTFANFLARVMNPYGFDQGDTSFVHQRYGGTKGKNVGAIFLQDPPSDGESPKEWPEDARRPWIIVPFNAWQMEHVSPPWWVFYQTIRQRCFASVLCEGNKAVDLRATTPPRKPALSERLGSYLGLLGREYWWRLKNPKVTTLLITALFSFGVLAVLHWLKIVDVSGPTLGFNLSTGIGVMLAGVTTIGTIWGVGSLFTESIVPGTETLAERLSLGSGDPFERFRTHFFETMERVKRPVMVIVDDLDRCKPDFIVDLVRGIQTLLRSPRVVFVILGDRDWIERAFEAHHKAMDKVSVGAEQTFGARFVEKAIQMSFILPGMGPSQTDYVRWVLRGGRAPRNAVKVEPIKPETAAMLREVIHRTADAQKDAPLETDKIRENAATAYQQFAPDSEKVDEQAAKERTKQFVNNELAIRAAVDRKVEEEISHRLEPLARYFPPNPRQIKRIINAVTMYYAVALQQQGLEASDDRWFQLALWVIVMTEWPETWRLLASYPDVVTVLSALHPEEEIKKIAADDLPGSRSATLKEINRIKADGALMALVMRADDRPGPPLDCKAIKELVALTPLHSRKARLKEQPTQEAKEDTRD